MALSSVGIIGYGAFGALTETLLNRFAPGVEVRIHSSSREADGKRFFAFEDACAADAAVLAVPIHAFEEVLERALLHARKDTVLVDVSSVKVHTATALRERAAGRSWIATHPMFGPESYEKFAQDVSGFRIVITDHTLQAKLYAQLRSFLASCGFSVIEMGSEEHDRLLAETLFVTHFIGETLRRAGARRTPIDTRTFGFLMDAAESVRHDGKLFRDVFAYDPFCKETLSRLLGAAEETKRSLETGEEPGILPS